MLLEPATRPVADERTWTNWAVENLQSDKVSWSPLRTHMVFYPPLYPYFIAAFHAVGGSLAAVKWAQALVSALLVPAIGLVGARVASARVGVAAAAVTAIYPELIWFSAHFWSETLFMAFLWWALAALYAAEDSGRVRTAVLAGGLWGLSILVRETALYFTPLAALWLALPSAERRWRVGPGAAFLVAALLTVAPWTLRNWVVFHAFVPVSTAGGLNLYQGNALLSREEVYARYEQVQGRIEQYRWARAEGLAAIRARQPGWAIEKLQEQMPNFWEADSLALIHVKRGAYGEVPVGAARLAAVGVLLPYLIVLPLFVMGLGRAFARGERRLGLLAWFLTFYNALHVITHGFARYRLPVMPAVFLLAAWWLIERDVPAVRPRLSRALAIVLAAALAWWLLPSVQKNLAHPAFGFATDPVGEAPAETP